MIHRQVVEMATERVVVLHGKFKVIGFRCNCLCRLSFVVCCCGRVVVVVVVAMYVDRDRERARVCEGETKGSIYDTAGFEYKSVFLLVLLFY